MSGEDSNTQGGGSGQNGCLTKAILIIIGITLAIVVLVFGPDILGGLLPAEPPIEPTIEAPISFDDFDFHVQDPGDGEVAKLGDAFEITTNNCNSPVSTFETISRSRQHETRITFLTSEEVVAEIVDALGIDVGTNVLAAVRADLERHQSVAIGDQIGIQLGAIETIESARTIETPPGYRSSIHLQWEEARAKGNVIMAKQGEAFTFESPFYYVTDLHLTQLSSEYSPCGDSAQPLDGLAVSPPNWSPTVAQDTSRSLSVLVPAHGEYKNPVVFEWESRLGVSYQVTARSLSQNFEKQSNWVEGSYWEYGLPADLWGSWEWFVVGTDGTRSATVPFVFNPFPNSNARTSTRPAVSNSPDETDGISTGNETSPVDQPVTEGGTVVDTPELSGPDEDTPSSDPDSSDDEGLTTGQDPTNPEPPTEELPECGYPSSAGCNEDSGSSPGTSAPEPLDPAPPCGYPGTDDCDDQADEPPAEASPEPPEGPEPPGTYPPPSGSDGYPPTYPPPSYP